MFNNQAQFSGALINIFCIFFFLSIEDNFFNFEVIINEIKSKGIDLDTQSQIWKVQ